MKIVAINGSPKMRSSNSEEVLSILQKKIGDRAFWSICTPIDEIRGRATIDMQQISNADVVVVAFPLYSDGIPASLMAFMEKCSTYLKKSPSNSKRIFAVVNCGFYEGSQTRVALKMVEHFTNASGQRWGGGVGIGTGEMIGQLKNISSKARIRRPVFAALQTVADAVCKYPDGKIGAPVFTQHAFPWLLYKIMGEFGWRSAAKKNGLKKRDLAAKPLEVVSAGGY